MGIFFGAAFEREWKTSIGEEKRNHAAAAAAPEAVGTAIRSQQRLARRNGPFRPHAGNVCSRFRARRERREFEEREKESGTAHRA